MKKINLEIVVFLCGAVVMAYEIIGSRILGPYVGTSMQVWSSIIGIMLLSLSIGYYSGGRIADRYPNYRTLALIIGGAGLFILVTLLFKGRLLVFLLHSIESIHVVSILSSLLLFSVPALLLGMVSPFAARLKIKDPKTSGATVGSLYALSTVGSIAGTFLAGFYLIPGYTLTSILLLLALTLLFVSAFVYIIYINNISNSITDIHSDEKN